MRHLLIEADAVFEATQDLEWLLLQEIPRQQPRLPPVSPLQPAQRRALQEQEGDRRPQKIVSSSVQAFAR